MYQALYRKWRPVSFDDVVGQPHITGTLKNELMSGRIAHAYVFTGSRGTGKTSCAKILAKAVNCLNLQNGNPCNKCAACADIDAGSLDISEIDAASNNGVDHIRDLREESNFTPVALKYRVYIIDEVHMLSTGAFNALLKTLEEPPGHVLFILATTEIHKLPATILSRCQRFDFLRIEAKVIADRLLVIAQQENIDLKEDAAELIARISDGGMRDAISLLDQCASHDKEISVSLVRQTAGLIGKQVLFNLANSVLKQDVHTILGTIHELHAASCDMERVCEELLGFYRNLLMQCTVPDYEDALFPAGAEERKELCSLANAYSITAIFAVMESLQETLEKMKRTSNRRIEFEMAMIRICTPRLGTSQTALLKRLESLEARIGAGMIHPADLTLETKKENVQASGKPVTEVKLEEEVSLGAEEETARVPFSKWKEVKEALMVTDRPLAVTMNDSSAYVSGETLLIDTEGDMFTVLVKQPEHRKNFHEAVAAQTGRTYRIAVKKTALQEKEEDPLRSLAEIADRNGIPVAMKGEEPG